MAGFNKKHFGLWSFALALVLADDVYVKTFLPQELSQIFKAVSPDDHDLGSTPKTLVDQVVDAATQMAKAAAEIVKKTKD